MLLIFSATRASQPRPGTTRSTRHRVSPSSSKSRSDPRSSCRLSRSPWVAFGSPGRDGASESDWQLEQELRHPHRRLRPLEPVPARDVWREANKGLELARLAAVN